MPQVPFTNPLGTPFIELASVDSTNNYALTRVHAGLAQHGAAFFSHEQLAGKGQRGKTWTVGRDEGIILSVVLGPVPFSLTRQFEWNACVAVSVREFFSRYAGDETTIKWPNDLYWQDRKAGGILIENVFIGNIWKWSVAGIGININQTGFPEGLRNPVSLLQITGRKFNAPDLARELCEVLDKNYQDLLQNGFDNILRLYNQHLFSLNKRARLRKENRVFDAWIRGVNQSGELQTRHSIEENFSFGEIEWVLSENNPGKSVPY